VVTFTGRGTLDVYTRALIADAFKAAGLDPSLAVIVKGSNVPADSLSGSTHAGGGAFDLRVWNLPPSRHEAVVVELRRRNVCAWKRDQEHGGFDPHIHGILRSATDLSSGARWQVTEYDAGRDGLKAGGKDYHPRPVQRRWPFTTPLPVVKWEDLKNNSRTQNRLVQESLNRLPGDRYSAPVTGLFVDTKGPLRFYRIATASLTASAALRKLTAATGNRWRVG
jgi:hypothetical protein